MNNTKVVISAILVSFITGCIPIGGTTTIKPNTPKSFYGTYLFVNPCHTELASAVDTKGTGTELAAALASGVVKTGIDWIGAALQRAAQDDIEKTTVSSNLTSISQMSDSDTNICLQVVRAEFKYAESNDNVYANFFSVNPKTRVVAPLQVIEGTEELFVEILPILHKKAISFTPLEVRYAGFTPGDRRSKKPRDLALFVGYSLIDKDVTAGEYAGRLINFGTLTPSGEKQATIKYVSDDGKLSLVNQTQWLSLPEPTNDQPITFAANVIETRKASQFTKFLAAAFESSKEDIKSKADAAVAELEIFKTSKELEKEKIQTEKERLANEQTYLDAIAGVLSKEEALTKLCGTEPSPTESQIYTAQKDIYFAKKNANISAASTVKSRPYPDSEIKSPNGKCGE
jgi:hypothetical protein